jgi:hypothetical protein
MNQSLNSLLLFILLRDSDIYGIRQLIIFWRVIVIAFILYSRCWGGRRCWQWSTNITKKCSGRVRVKGERGNIFNKTDSNLMTSIPFFCDSLCVTGKGGGGVCGWGGNSQHSALKTSKLRLLYDFFQSEQFHCCIR